MCVCVKYMLSGEESYLLHWTNSNLLFSLRVTYLQKFAGGLEL